MSFSSFSMEQKLCTVKCKVMRAGLLINGKTTRVCYIDVIKIVKTANFSKKEHDIADLKICNNILNSPPRKSSLFLISA